MRNGLRHRALWFDISGRRVLGIPPEYSTNKVDVILPGSSESPSQSNKRGDKMRTLEDREGREIQRHQAIEDAVNAADHIIMTFSDGSNEETNYLTAEVACRFCEKAFIPFTSALWKKDLQD